MKIKKGYHSLEEANEYAKQQGYKYEERGLDAINVGDTIECGLNTWCAVEKTVHGNESEITYKIVGTYIRADDEYFSNVQETPQEKCKKTMEYYKEWVEKQNNKN